jgi:hypothetical protein
MTTVRRAGATSAATLFGLALTIGLADVAAPEWIEAVGLDLWDVPTYNQEMESTAKSASSVAEEIEGSKRRQALKERLIDGLLSKHLTLREVTKEFLALNDSRPLCKLMIHTSFDGATDEEKTAQNVLFYAVRRKQGSLIDHLQTIARLTHELDELKLAAKNPAK